MMLTPPQIKMLGYAERVGHADPMPNIKGAVKENWLGVMWSLVDAGLLYSEVPYGITPAGKQAITNSPS